MTEPMERRDFLKVGTVARATTEHTEAHVAFSESYQASATIHVSQLYDNLYLLQNAGGNVVLQTGDDGNLLIDSSFALSAPRILETIARLTPQAQAGGILINTHWHLDHTGGNAEMHKAGFRIIAHRKTRERLSTPQISMLTHESIPPSPPEAWPEIGIDERLTIWRNGDVIDVKHIPPSHSDTDLSISFSKADVLHMGDLWFNGIYPVIDEISGGSISGTIHEVEKVLAEVSASTKIIPGHGPVGGKDELQKFHAMLTGIRDKVAALKTQGLSEEAVIAQKPTAEFDATYKEEYMKIDALVGVVYRTL